MLWEGAPFSTPNYLQLQRKEQQVKVETNTHAQQQCDTMGFILENKCSQAAFKDLQDNPFSISLCSKAQGSEFLLTVKVYLMRLSLSFSVLQRNIFNMLIFWFTNALFSCNKSVIKPIEFLKLLCFSVMEWNQFPFPLFFYRFQFLEESLHLVIYYFQHINHNLIII